jgi:hypothetical protein
MLKFASSHMLVIIRFTLLFHFLSLPGLIGMSQLNTFWLQSTNYIRLENLGIGYTFNPRSQQESDAGKLRIYLSGFNLLTFSKFKLFDPELLSGEAYPPQRIINLELKFTLKYIFNRLYK